MADCLRCGRKLPAFSFGKNSNLCSYCREAEKDDIQPGGHVSQLVPAWRVGPSVTMAIIAVTVLAAALAPWVAPFDPSQQFVDPFARSRIREP